MGLVDGLLGNASEVEISKVQEEYGEMLLPEEEVHRAYQLIRDLFIFTNKRLIFVDKQGIVGKKIEYLSLPYKRIVRFSIETAGVFDLDAELRIWVAGEAAPIARRFNRHLNVYDVQRVLAHYVL